MLLYVAGDCGQVPLQADEVLIVAPLAESGSDVPGRFGALLHWMHEPTSV
ncbi:hypothetical protein ABS735_30455 [Streptomyces sp. MMCC 100]